MAPLAVVPTYLRSAEDVDVIKRCLASMRATADVEIMVVDDQSPHRGAIDLDSDVFMQCGENRGFSATVNEGMRRAHGEERDVLLVNADMEFIVDGWLDALTAAEADIVGGLLLYPDRTVQHAGVYFSLLTRGWDHRMRYAPHDLPDLYTPRLCPVTAALQLIRFRVMDEIGFYDEDFPLAFEDVDYCIRARDAGFHCLYEPRCVATHHESVFRGDGHKSESEEASWLHFIEKWGETDFGEYLL